MEIALLTGPVENYIFSSATFNSETVLEFGWRFQITSEWRHCRVKLAL